MQNDKIEIPLSKRKIKISFTGALLFIGCGAWILVDPDGSKIQIFNDIAFLYLSDIAGIVIMLFFGFVAFALFLKLNENKPGLVLNHDGIIDNSSGKSSGLILWSDIQDINTVRVLNQRFIRFVLKNPQYYIDKETSSLKRKTMLMNYKLYGSPVHISPGLLKTDFDSLKAMLKHGLNEYLVSNIS